MELREEEMMCLHRKFPASAGAGLVVVSWAAFTGGPGFAGAVVSPHRLRPDGCQTCHSETAATVTPKVVESCVSCHRDMPRGRRDAAVAEPDVSGDVVKTELAFPMYSERSRLGPEPNPMVKIPAGPFIRGTNDRLPDEGPEHRMNVDEFYIDIYEVTNLQYKKFIDETHRKSPQHFVNRRYPKGKADHPVTYVSWYDAQAYCQWAGKRLPTDIEWEKAARGTDGRTYPWGNAFNINYANTPQRWAALGKEGDTTPVGAFPEGRSVYGVYDMSGNVWEWTSSWYLPYPGNQRVSENYGEIYKTLKGGSWWDCSFYKCGISAPLYNRSFFLRGTRNKSFGFRCAKDGEQTGQTSTLKARHPAAPAAGP